MKTLILSLVFFSSYAQAEKPYWAEKATFEEDGKIFFVGVALRCRDEVECRERTLQAAQSELKAYLGGYDSKGLPLYTQMIQEEKNFKDGGINMYRLSWTFLSDFEVFYVLKTKESGLGTRRY